MNASEIRVGAHYRGNRFVRSPFGRNNDRVVIWISPERTHVQYDSDTVGIGHRQPIIPIEQFAKWAKRELTADEIKAYYA